MKHWHWFFYIGGHTVKKLTTLQGLRDTTPSKLTYCFTSVSLQELHILEAVDCVSKNVSWLWFYSCFQSAICSLRLRLLCSMWQCSGIHSLKSGLYISAFSKPPIFSLSQANPSISVASCSVYKFLHSWLCIALLILFSITSFAMYSGAAFAKGEIITFRELVLLLSLTFVKGCS